MAESPARERNQFLRMVAVGYAILWLATAIAPRDWGTWSLENLPVAFVAMALWFTRKRFLFSNASYLLIALFFSLHAIGAHTGYAHSQIGFWAKDVFELNRNYYDRFVHFAFGLLLAWPFREVLLRSAGVTPRAAAWFAVILVAAGSAAFECVEALIAETVSPGTGPDWLGAQGDEWDAQLDMLMALIGAALTMLSTWRPARGRPANPLRPGPNPEKPFRERRFLQSLCALYVVAWVAAAIRPLDRGDWLLENLLVFAFVPFLVVSYRRRPLSNFSYALLFLFLLQHALGAHYTYAKVPLGDWMKEAFGLERNHFDRVVHFNFGLLLTLPLANLLRMQRLKPFWSGFLPAAAIVSLSGTYEIIEAVVAWLVAPELGQAYLGTQGDIWDGQKDMALALVGSAIAAGAWVGVLNHPRRARSSQAA